MSLNHEPVPVTVWTIETTLTNRISPTIAAFAERSASATRSSLPRRDPER
jgi:hypothetical protein